MSLESIKADLLRQDVCVLGEGPFWHDEQLWWVDIERGFLLSTDLRGCLVECVEFGQRIAVAIPAGPGILLVALEREIVQLDLVSKKWQTIVLPKDIPEGSRFNDGKADARGRWLIGTLSMKGDAQTSSLYSLHQDHSLHVLRRGVTLSNGLAWTADGRTMYYIDTTTLCVLGYDYNMETGGISEERIVLRFSEDDGWPDGMTIDRQGRLWIGFWDGWAVRCYQPQTGICERIVSVPCSRPTSCCFGGAEWDRLFITTARTGLTEQALLEQPLAGSLFVCDSGTTGFPTSLFHDQTLVQK